jgi:hypothetical protein
MLIRDVRAGMLIAGLLVSVDVWSMSYWRSVGAVLSLDAPSKTVKVRGAVELRGLSQSESRRLMATVRVHGTPGGRDKVGRIKVSDNSMNVATPSADGAYDLVLDRQQLWLLEAEADGFETAAVVVPGGGVVDFVLLPASPRK